MDYGVFYIDDHFSNWQPFSNNLPNIKVTELAINKVTDQIIAGTYGRGVWYSDLYSLPTVGVPTTWDNSSIRVYPNPTSRLITISSNIDDPSTIRVFNSLGELMFYENKTVSKFIQINCSQWAAGSYYVRINNSKGIHTHKIGVSH
jgi:hypothetical protein